MTKAKIGADNWTEDGIEPIKAHLAQADALLDALNERAECFKCSAIDAESLRIINALGTCLREVRGAIFELELFGLETKRSRAQNHE